MLLNTPPSDYNLYELVGRPYLMRNRIIVESGWLRKEYLNKLWQAFKDRRIVSKGLTYEEYKGQKALGTLPEITLVRIED